MRGLSYGSYCETLYSMPLSGAVLSSSTARTLLSLASTATGAEPFRLPPTFWDPGRLGQSFRVTARGWFSTAGTPAFTFAAALDTGQGTFGTVLAATGAFATPSGASNYLLDAGFDCTVQGLGTSGYLTVGGRLAVGPAGNGATATAAVYGLGTSSDVAVNTTVDNYLEIWGTWGSASASNFIQLYQFAVTGLNLSGSSKLVQRDAGLIDYIGRFRT